ncbi:J domain-containing protein [Streptococcus oralis]|jgi:dnaJ domain protein|uniref:J domain-containing protein n=1 Tax=Streptococcus oralis subsp. oralis TaxID=1891914 RepID=A0A7H9FL51_STROR|nr:J domain-containing protein [Streptococcus oralis]MCM3310220.1 J domain-containing protein [Streptococcus oralis]QLL98568.1 J domain-containing protein [Streptococcus oralis subsp. oralis]
MNIWETLGIEPTTDVKLIRRRYAELVRLYHPEDQPEIYQEIVEAYQKALTYARSRNTRPENSLRKASDSQEATELEEEANEKPNSSLHFENLTEETKTENEESERSSLDFSDYQQSTDKFSDSFNFETFKAEENEQKSTLDFSDYDEEVQLNGDSEERATNPLNFETFGDEENRGQEGTTRSTLDFSSYNEAAYLIRNAIESIVKNDDYSPEEQEHLWRQFFHQYQYDMDIVQSVLEEMDVYIFNKSEQFSILIPLLEDYIPDFRYWGYYYKLKYWKVKRATVNKNRETLETAKKETTKFHVSYRLCQAILEDSQRANQIGTWIKFFNQSFSSSAVLFLLNSSKQIITSIPVLTFILEKIEPEMREEDKKDYDELVVYLNELNANLYEPFDIHHYNLLNPSEVEEKLYLLLYSPYQDEYKLLRDWQYLFKSVKDHTLLLDLLEKVDVYPLTNAKVLALVLQFVECYSDEESNAYLKKLNFWKSIHSYPSVVEEYALNKKENFDYWYNEGYLYIDKLTKSDEDINDWEKWRSYFKGRPRILTILLQQIYKEYHRFTDGDLLRYVLAPFPTSKMAPQMMTEETDQKLEEMTVYAYELSHPKAKLSYLDWKKRQVFKNKFLQLFFGLFSIVSLILSVLEQPIDNLWVHAGMFSLFYVYMLKLRKTPIEEGVTARGEKRKFYYSPHPWFLFILLLLLVIPSLPFGLIGALMFITFFSFIDGFQVSQGLKWDYSLDKLIPIGIFLSAGFLSALVNQSQTISGVAIAYFHIFAILVICLSFTRFSPGFPPSLKKIFIPAILGILLFQTLPYIHSRLDIFDPDILRDETLTITVLLLLNGIALSYFTKEQGFTIGVKKVFMIYGLQIFIFLRRLFRILFAPNSVFDNKYFNRDLLILNSEFAFYFLEGLFVLIMLFLIRNIRKENRKSAA